MGSFNPLKDREEDKEDEAGTSNILGYACCCICKPDRGMVVMEHRSFPLHRSDRSQTSDLVTDFEEEEDEVVEGEEVEDDDDIDDDDIDDDDD